MRRPRWLLLGVLFIAPPLPAIQGVELHLDTLAGAGWQAQDISVQLDQLNAASASLHLVIAQLVLPEPFGTLKDVRLDCPALLLRDEELNCAQAPLRLVSPWLDARRSVVTFSYRPVERALTLTLRDAGLANGRVTLTARTAANGWRIDYELAGIDLAHLPDSLKRRAGLTTASGRASLRGSVSGVNAVPDAFSVQARLQALAFATPSGSNASEALNAQGSIDAQHHGDDWRVQSRFTLHDGTLCLKTCWELPADPLTLDADATWSAHAQRLDLIRLTFRQSSLGHGEATLRLLLGKTPRLTDFTLRLAPSRWERLYPTYLQPLLIGSPLETVTVQGSVAAAIDYHATAPSAAHVQLDGTSLEDRDGRFGIKGLAGDLAWRSDAAVQHSTLHWDAAHIYKLTLGAASVQAQSEAHSLRLLQPLHLPILDGQLDIEQFALQGGPDTPLRWHFDGLLEPVSMQAFSTAIGWPEMQGKLSGMIPDVRYANGELRIGGILLIRAFDGAITVRGLRIARLFEVAPTLNAEVTLDNLDLDALTRAFSFGNIQGRLSGQVDGLQIIDWRPVAFAARFATPADDRSRHRISQRAVENISQIGGGGIGGTLSRSLLRVFDEFTYDRIGISCTLHNGVCTMDGVAPAAQGYYLVKGGGLPRIDIIGYAHRVDWDTLLERLNGAIGAAPSLHP